MWRKSLLALSAAGLMGLGLMTAGGASASPLSPALRGLGNSQLTESIATPVAYRRGARAYRAGWRGRAWRRPGWRARGAWYGPRWRARGWYGPRWRARAWYGPRWRRGWYGPGWRARAWYGPRWYGGCYWPGPVVVVGFPFAGVAWGGC